jgi:hypothetical protein
MKFIISLLALTISLSAFSAKILDPKSFGNSTIPTQKPLPSMFSKPVVACGPGQKPPCDPVSGESLANFGKRSAE